MEKKQLQMCACGGVKERILKRHVCFFEAGFQIFIQYRKASNSMHFWVLYMYMLKPMYGREKP